MEKNFEEIMEELKSSFGYDGRGDIVDYADIISACNALNLPLMSMQDVSDFEKAYNLIIEW